MKSTEKKNESSTLKEALLEYENLVNTAKKMVVENNTKEFNSILDKMLKESETKNEPTKANTKESGKDNKIQESIVQGAIGEIKEEVAVVAPNVVNMKEASLAEIESAFDANSGNDFQVVRGSGVGDPAMSSSEPTTGDQVSGNNNSFDLTTIESEIDEMMKEINQAEQVQAQQAQAQAEPMAGNNVPMAGVDRFKQIHEEMGKYLKEIEEMNQNEQLMNEFHGRMSEMYGEGYQAQMDENMISELLNQYKRVKSGSAGTPVNSMKETMAVAPAAPVAESAPVVDEAHGVSLSHNKLVGQEVQPRIENGKEYAEHRVRLALQKESIDKKMTSALQENLKLSKSLKEAKDGVKTTTTSLTEAKEANKKLVSLNENYKSNLEKYRDQLKDMAVLNTNISYVNNLLINESLALTAKEKEQIIEKFKAVGTINESEKTYKEILKEFTDKSKSSIDKVEDKVSTIVESSSANMVGNEVINEQDEKITKMLKLSGYKTDKKVV